MHPSTSTSTPPPLSTVALSTALPTLAPPINLSPQHALHLLQPTPCHRGLPRLLLLMSLACFVLPLQPLPFLRTCLWLLDDSVRPRNVGVWARVQRPGDRRAEENVQFTSVTGIVVIPRA